MPPNLAIPVYAMYTQLSESAADFEGRYANILSLIAGTFSGAIRADDTLLHDGSDDAPRLVNLTNTMPATSCIIVFGPNSYTYKTVVQITRRSLRFIGAGGNRRSQGGGTEFVFAPSAALQANPVCCITVGVSGVAGDPWSDPSYSANNYGGPQQFYIEHISFQCAAATMVNLDNAVSTYGVNTGAIRDFFAGDINIRNCWWEHFQYGFWGAGSDFDHIENCRALYCHVGAYFGPRSDQHVTIGFQGGSCDTFLQEDGATNGVHIGLRSIGCGAPGAGAAAGVKISGGTNDCLLVGPWFETMQNTYNVEAQLEIGGTTDAAITRGVTIQRPVFVTNPQAAPPHAQYCIRFGNANRVVIDRWGAGVANNYLKHFLFTHAANATHVEVEGHDDLKPTFDVAAGAVAGIVSYKTTGYGAVTFGGANGRIQVEYTSQPVGYVNNYTISSESQFALFCYFQNRSNDYILSLRRRFWTGTAIPTAGAPAVGQSWTPGDVCFSPGATGPGKVWGAVNIVNNNANPDFRPMGVVPGVITKGDADFTVVAGTDAPTVRISAALTANRAATLDIVATPWMGAKFRIVRQATSTGAFSLNVTANAVILKALATGQWADFEYDASATGWIEVASGNL